MKQIENAVVAIATSASAFTSTAPPVLNRVATTSSTTLNLAPTPDVTKSFTTALEATQRGGGPLNATSVDDLAEEIVWIR